MFKAVTTALFLAAAGFAFPAAAQGDLKTGTVIAETWCAACHAIKRGTSAMDAAPPFRTLARERTAEELKAFLAHPHGLMPNIQLSRQQVGDVVVYIESLR
jgi:mono/diheme cytochrome c family protein